MTGAETVGRAVREGRLSQADAAALSQVVDDINARVGNLFVLKEFIGSTLRFRLFRAVDARTGRSVLATLLPPPGNGPPDPLDRFRAMLSRVADPRLGVEYGNVTVPSVGGEWAACFSTFHADAEPLGSFCVNRATDARAERPFDDAALLELLRSIVEQLSGLHQAGYAHGDLSPTNILVDPHGVPHLIDFDLLVMTGEEMQLSSEGATPDFTHPDKLARLGAAVAGTGPEPQHDERVRWDIYSLGKTLRAVLTSYAPEEFFRSISPFTQRYVALMYCRMLDGRNVGGEGALGIPTHAFAAISYSSADEILRDIQKLDKRYSVIRSVPELDLTHPDRLQVSSRFEVVLTDRLKSTLQLPALQALAGVRQLGLINLVFPSANHSRYEHALGTYAVTCQYVRWLLRDVHNPLFLQLLTDYHVKCLLLAALLHDIGHYPLGHDFEDAEHSLFDHEHRTAETLLAPGSELAKDLARREPDGWDVRAQDVVCLLSAERAQAASILHQILHTIISGPIDADKVDYLIRDSERLGVQYGQGLDVRRLGSTLTTIVDFAHAAPGAPATVGIGVREKGVGAAETVAFARYAMYRNVYWHHSYRVVKAMIQWVVWEFLRRVWRETRGQRGAFKKAVDDRVSRLLGRPSRMDQLLLLPDEETIPGLAGLMALIPAAERAVLEWCARDSRAASRMTDALVERNLFKRVLVLSVDRGISRDSWASLGTFFDSGADGRGAGWMRRYVLACRFQRHVVETILESERAGSYLIGDTRKRRALAEAHAERQIVLVDFPNPNRAKQVALRYLVEEERRHRRVDVEQQMAVDESKIFADIGDSFVAGIGKIRVFADPEFAPLITDSLSRDELQRGFLELLDRVRLAQPENEAEFAASDQAS